MSSLPIVILTEGNWLAWQRQTQVNITKGGAWDVITPGLKAPPIAKADAPTLTEYKEERNYNRLQGFALGTITETISDANYRLVQGKSAKEAYEALQAAHNKTNSQRQFRLYQELQSVQQLPNEALTTFHSRVILAGDALKNSFTSAITPAELVDTIVSFTTLTNLLPDDSNEQFVQTIQLAATTIDQTNLDSYFRAEQERRDTKDKKEAALAASTPGAARKSGRKCKHCGKAHNSDDCYKTYPEKMPDWLKTKIARQNMQSRNTLR